ncbi:MAG: hypothetical protein E7168_06065 [Firmicutes bacterium]|nr:hypothetical protein [Bacillota bacterium]
MKKLSFLFFMLAILAFTLAYNDKIVSFIVEKLVLLNKTTTVLENNEYASGRDYEFVQLVDTFEPKSKEEILNIYYTVINSGMTEFIFYCPKEYENCLNDVNYISNNQALLSNINNFVQVYNSFSNVATEFDNLGKVTIRINHTYTKEQISEINNIVDTIMKEVTTEGMTSKEKIKAIHDYIINNTKYDQDRSDNKIINYHSDTAYGALVEHYAVCGGYADSMKIFLDRLGINNFKIASENHIWNYVYLDDKWYHLDLTWDDPITDTGVDVLDYDYFLITTEELHTKDTDQHIYDKSVYLEASN